jgi:translocation and assembly module TamB
VSRTRKLIFAAVAGLAGLCLLILGTGVVVLRSDWFQDQVRQRIVREVESATGGRAEIGAFLFDWRQLRAEIRSFVLHGTEKPGEPALFSAKSVQVGLKIISIWRRGINIASLTVTQPRVRIVVYEDGRTNLPQPRVARLGRNPFERILALSIGQFGVSNGLLEVDQRQIPLDFQGQDLSARLSYEAAGPRYTGYVSFRRLTLVSPSLLPAAMDADMSLDLEGNRLVIRKARLATPRSSAELAGTVENLLSPRGHLSVDARLWLAEVQSLAKLPPSAQGVLRFAGEMSFAGRSDYLLAGSLSGRELSAKVAGMSFRDLSVTSRVSAAPEKIDLTRLSVWSKAGAFSGMLGIENSRRFRLEGELGDVSISGVASLRGMKPPPWNGTVSGPVTIEGAWASGGPRDAKLAARLSIAPSGEERPLEGLVELTLDQRAGTLEFAASHLATAASRLQFSGTLSRNLRVDFESRNLAVIVSAASFINTAAPREIPIALRDGSARFQGTVVGDLSNPRLSGHVSIANFVYQGRLFDRLEADTVISRAGFEAVKAVLEQGGAALEGRLRLALDNWKPVDSSQVAGAFSLRGLPIERLAAEAGKKIPVHGKLSGTFQVSGTLAQPQIVAGLSVGQAEAYGQRIDQGRARIRYASRSLSVESFDVRSGAAQVRGSAEFAHQADNWQSGALRFNISASDARLRDLRASVDLPDQVDGVLDLQFRGAASANDAKFLLTDLQGKVLLRKISVNGRLAGDLQFTARTQAETLAVDGTGELAGAKIKAQASCLLRGEYPVQGALTFGRISLSDLRPWLASASSSPPPLEASADGNIVFKGAGLDPDRWSARVEMPAVEILPPPSAKSPVPGLHNAGLVVLAVNRKEIRIIAAQFAGLDTNVEASGRIDLSTRYNAYDIRFRGGINLAILRNLDPNLTASGESTLDASIRGPRSQPEVYGRLDLKKASLYLSDVPNGLDNVNGVVFLFRDRATIENLTAETGGGKLTLNGFVGYGEQRLSYRLRGAASNVRIRYPQGVSTTVDASLDLTGTSSRSLLSGTVTILRSGVSANTDLASLLTRSSQPMLTPATQNELLRGMQFEVRVLTSPNARFDTMLTRDIRAEAELRVQGTPYKPVLLGRISIHQGEVNFLGNRYTITRGEISFLNPVRLEPVLDLDLSTRVRGIDVSMNFTGPMDRLNVTYRSDPPLQVQEIIALLAVGRAPTSDPALLARQSERDQNWQQLGASTLVGQALATPVAGRLQRFFGVSRIKIDPQLTGLSNYPGAQLTLEQQISSNVTFTYVTSLAQEQQQLIRVEWNVSRQWSILAVRQENGLFGIQFQYRKQFK